MSAWTTEPPMAPGWYWWRDARDTTSTWIFKIEHDPDTNVLRCREGHSLFDMDGLVAGEWQAVQPAEE